MKKKITNQSNGNLNMFQGADFKNSSPSKKALFSSIVQKQEELRLGQLDFDRHRPYLKQIEEAAACKHSRFHRVAGELMDVKFAKYLLKFMRDWARRRSQLVWELEELKREIEK